MELTSRQRITSTTSWSTRCDRLLPQLSQNADIPTPELIREIVDGPASTLLIARDTRDGGRIVGMLTLVVFRIPTGVRAWIEDVVVDAAVRGRGVGEALSHGRADARGRRGRTHCRSDITAIARSGQSPLSTAGVRVARDELVQVCEITLQPRKATRRMKISIEDEASPADALAVERGLIAHATAKGSSRATTDRWRSCCATMRARHRRFDRRDCVGLVARERTLGGRSVPWSALGREADGAGGRRGGRTALSPCVSRYVRFSSAWFLRTSRLRGVRQVERLSEGAREVLRQQTAGRWRAMKAGAVHA